MRVSTCFVTWARSKKNIEEVNACDPPRGAAPSRAARSPAAVPPSKLNPSYSDEVTEMSNKGDKNTEVVFKWRSFQKV